MTTAKTARRATGHLHPLSHYSALYKIPPQTILNAHKRHWPLDKPAKLLEHFLNAPGPKSDLRELERIANGGKTPKKRDEPPSEPRPTDSPLSHLSVGLAHEVERLTKECERSFREFKNEPSPVQRKTLQKVYQQNIAILQKLVPVASKAEVEAGRLLSAADVEATWSRALGEIRSALDLLSRRVATLPVFGKCDPVEVELAVQAEVEKICVHLAAAGWVGQNESPAK